MMDCKPQSTPLASRIAPPTNSENFHDPTLYRAIVGSLQYRTFTRPDLTFTVNYVSQFMSQPTDFHFSLVKCILRYPKHTLHYCHNILSISQLNLSDWDGCPLTRWSTTGYITLLGLNVISSSSKKQQTISRLSTEAKYRALAAATAELTWIGFLIKDLQILTVATPNLYSDNVSALHLIMNEKGQPANCFIRSLFLKRSNDCCFY